MHRLIVFFCLLFLISGCADAQRPTDVSTSSPTSVADSDTTRLPSQDAATSSQALLAARQRLERARDTYRQIMDDGGWPTVPDGPLVAPGDTARDQVSALRARLGATDALGQAAAEGAVYDEDLAAAVARFQRRHALTVDSLLGANTRAALNVPAQQRVAQIEATLDAWNDLPDMPTGPDARYIIVNVPEFRLRAFEGNREALQMKVVVGADYDGRATPLFHDEMEHVIFQPYWNVPPSIARDELVPDGPAELDQQGFELVSHYAPDAEVYPMTSANLDRVAAGSLRLRQKGGQNNALGLVKFIFPNSHAVYLHDTPADRLFDESTRAFSHGCIRVEKPVELGAWVLGPQGWEASRVEEAMHEGGRQKVILDETVPVFIVYLLVYADDSGAVYFLEDLYDEYADV